MWLVVVVLAAAAWVLLQVLRLQRHTARLDRLTASVPGPPRLPLVGNAHLILGAHDKLYDVLDEQITRYGTLSKFWFGPFLVVAVLDPDDVQVVMTSPHMADKANAFYEAGLVPVIGRGLITINGLDYKRHRRAITASMHLDILQDFVTTFSANSRALVGRLSVLADEGEVFDVVPHLGWSASRTVCQTVLASEALGLEAERAALVSTVHSASRLMLYRSLRPWYRSDLLFSLSAEHRDYQAVVAGISDFATKVLRHKLDQLGRGATPPKGRRQTFLDQFLTSSEACVLSRGELLDELKTLLFSGSSTSMDFQSLFLLCMALEPDVQRKVQKELDDVFGSEVGRDIVATDLPHMTYLECALKEALRFFSPVPVFGRQATQDVVLPSGQVLPRGCYVGMVPLLMHRDPRHFPDPYTFDPERFSPERSRARHPYAFIPFSAGLRNCIGQRYALMFAKTAMASLLREFDVLPDPKGPRTLRDVPLIGGISLTVKGGVRVRLQRRRHVATPTAPAAPTTPEAARQTRGIDEPPR